MNTVTLHSKIVPSAEPSDMEPLLVIHGLFGMGDNWGSHARHWSTLGMEVHLLDMRNHGRSPHTASHTYLEMVADVLAYMEVHGMKSVNVLGHSMGGKVAMELATKHPGRVTRMIVVDIAPKVYPPHHQHILDAMHSLDFDSLSSRTEADRMLEPSLKDWGIRQFLLKNLEWKADKKLGWKFNFQVLVSQINRVGEGLSAHDQYAGASLFIRGNQSGYIQDEDLVQILEHFPLAQLESIDDAGHWVHAEQPAAFRAAVDEFMLA